VEYPAAQLGIKDASCVKRYPERRSRVYEHAQEIQKQFKYRETLLGRVSPYARTAAWRGGCPFTADDKRQRQGADYPLLATLNV
jgi:hypothetical protein